jgi:hypothetical protein
VESTRTLPEHCVLSKKKVQQRGVEPMTNRTIM